MTTTATGFLDTDAVRGIDVSHFQGQIDWAQVVGAGIQFCYVKASDGIAFSDVRFQANYSGSKTAGLRTGAYHFFRAGGKYSLRRLFPLDCRLRPQGCAAVARRPHHLRDLAVLADGQRARDCGEGRSRSLWRVPR